MVSLLAVDPDGSRGVGDGVGVSGEVWSNVVRGHETRVEATSERRAGALEGALSGGVVLGVEDELDDVTLGSGDVIRLEGELASSTDDDLVNGSRSGGSSSSGVVGSDGGRSSSRGGCAGVRAAVVVRISSGSGVGVGHSGGGSDGSDARGDGDGWGSGGSTGSESLVVVERLWIGVSGGVDGEDHSLLAVISLRAESPDWLGVLDGDPELRKVLGHALGNGHVAREEAVGDTVGISDGAARVGKSRLGDGVVLATEGEADRIARVGGHRLGLELEDTITTNEDVDDSGGGERSGENSSSEDTGEHLDCLVERDERNVFFLALKEGRRQGCLKAGAASEW